MNFGRRVRVTYTEQSGSDAGGTLVGIQQGLRAAVKQCAGFAFELSQTCLNAFILLAADQCTHTGVCIAWIAGADGGEFTGRCFSDCVQIALGYQRTARRGTALTALDGHVAYQIVDIQIECLSSWCRIFGEYRDIEAIGFNVHAHRVACYRWVTADFGCGVSRPGKRHHIKGGECIQ